MKSLTLLGCVLAVLGAVTTATLYVREAHTRRGLVQQLAAAEKRVHAAEATSQARAAEQVALTQRLTAIDMELGESKSRATAAETKAVQATREATQLRKQLADAPLVEQDLTRQLAAVQRELADARMAPPTLPGGLSDTEATALREQVDRLQRRLAAAEARAITAPLPPPTPVRPPDGPPATPPPSPHVVAIGNGNAFVVIDYSEEQGARAAQSLQISREGQPIALALISETRGRYAVAQIVPDSLRGALRKGDSVAMVTP